MKAMLCIMKYCVNTPKRGWLLQPDYKYDGNPEFELTVMGMSDSDFAKDPDTRKSVSGNCTFLCGAPVIVRSSTQRIVALSVTEAELFAATATAQDMLFVKRICESIGLKVKLPMQLKINNKGTVDLINGNSVGGRTRHVETRQYFLRGLKEQNIIKSSWIPGSENCTDIQTKNLAKRDFEKHLPAYVGNDEYMNIDASRGESVRGVRKHPNNGCVDESSRRVHITSVGLLGSYPHPTCHKYEEEVYCTNSIDCTDGTTVQESTLQGKLRKTYNKQNPNSSAMHREYSTQEKKEEKNPVS